MKEAGGRIRTLVLVGCLLFSLLALAGCTGKMTATDVPETAWYCKQVTACYENRWMSGVDSTHFAPEEAVSRGVMVEALWRFAGAPKCQTQCPFTDVSKSDSYAKAACWAAQLGMVSGETFSAQEMLTREQLLELAFGYAKTYGYGWTDGKAAAKYTDLDQVSAQALPAIEWAAEYDFVPEGADTLRPRQQATRAQAAAVLYRFLQKRTDPPADVTLFSNTYIENAEGETLTWREGQPRRGGMEVLHYYYTEPQSTPVSLGIPNSPWYRFEPRGKADLEVDLTTSQMVTFISGEGIDSCEIYGDGRVTLTGNQMQCSVYSHGRYESSHRAASFELKGTCTGEADFTFLWDRVIIASDCTSWEITVSADFLEHEITQTVTVPTPVATVQLLQNGNTQTGYFVVN